MRRAVIDWQLGCAQAGLTPVVGSILAQLIAEIIPEQRWQRIETYVQLLGERLDSLEGDKLEQVFAQPENTDLFEEGAVQSSRALSKERQTQIVELVARGISGEDAQRSQAKRLLNLLREVDDAQVVILARYLQKNQRDKAYYHRHRAVLEPIESQFGCDRATIDAATIQRAATQHLFRLDLLQDRDGNNVSGLHPARRTHVELTPLGHLLLRHIGLAQPEDL